MKAMLSGEDMATVMRLAAGCIRSLLDDRLGGEAKANEALAEHARMFDKQVEGLEDDELDAALLPTYMMAYLVLQSAAKGVDEVFGGERDDTVH